MKFLKRLLGISHLEQQVAELSYGQLKLIAQVLNPRELTVDERGRFDHLHHELMANCIKSGVSFP